jgi:hypothetical protein
MTRMSVHDVALRLVSIVADDPGLSDSVRKKAAALWAVVTRNPDLALEQLDRLALAAIPTLPLVAPMADLAKCVGIENYWAFYLDGKVRAFLDSETYRRQVELAPNPSRTLLMDLKTDPILIAAIHSWLVLLADVEGLDADEIRNALAIRGTAPYAIFVFPVGDLRAAGVMVRTPRAVDAVPERLVEWRLGGLASGATELIDQNIPRRALGSIQWRP